MDNIPDSLIQYEAPKASGLSLQLRTERIYIYTYIGLLSYNSKQACGIWHGFILLISVKNDERFLLQPYSPGSCLAAAGYPSCLYKYVLEYNLVFNSIQVKIGNLCMTVAVGHVHLLSVLHDFRL